MKRKLMFVLSLAVLLSIFMITPKQVEAKSNVTYTLNGGTLTIQGKGKMPKSMTFKNNKRIKKVVVKKGVTSVSDRAFYKCKNLKKVILPNSVTKIGNWSFWGTKITSVKFPKSVKTIGNRAFWNTKLKSVKIPDSVKTIGNYAFYNCKKLKKVTLGKSVKQIGNYAFCGANLMRITFPDSVKKIGNYVVGNQKKLKSITMSGDFKMTGKEKCVENCGAEKITFTTNLNIKNIQFLYADSFEVTDTDSNFTVLDGCIYTKDKKTLVRVPAGMEKLNVAEGCETVCVSALQYNQEWNFKLWLCNTKALKELRLPKTVKTIDDKSFVTYDTSNAIYDFRASVRPDKLILDNHELSVENLFNLLNYITCNETAVLEQFSDKIIHRDEMYIYNGKLLRYAGNKETVNVPEDITGIGTYAFYDNKSVRGVILPEGLKTIDSHAFCLCTALEKVNIPKGTTVADKAFDTCMKLGY